MGHMPRKRGTPSWSDLKGKLDGFDRTALIGLIKAMHASNAENAELLAMRLGFQNSLASLEERIEKAIAPEMPRGQVDLAAGKKVIADFRRTVGPTAELVSLRLTYCEHAIDFAELYGLDDKPYLNAIPRQFEDALNEWTNLVPRPAELATRAEKIATGCELAYGVADTLRDLLDDYCIQDLLDDDQGVEPEDV